MDFQNTHARRRVFSLLKQRDNVRFDVVLRMTTHLRMLLGLQIIHIFPSTLFWWRVLNLKFPFMSGENELYKLIGNYQWIYRNDTIYSLEFVASKFAKIME